MQRSRLLVEHRDRLVPSSELLAHVWQRRFVEPATLNSRLKTARQAIGDDGREQKFIRTLRGRGFRFVATVEVRNGSAEARPTPAAPPTRAPQDAIAHAVGPALDPADTLERARTAFARAAWRTAYDLLASLDAERELQPDDLERLGEAAWWLMDRGTCVRALERAYRAYVRSDGPRGAGRVALALAEDHFHWLARAVGQGWLRRAERHLDGLDDVAEGGWLHRLRAEVAITEHRLDDALANADRALEIGRRTCDADLEALALQDRGRILVALGRVADGMALVDEAMAVVTTGALTPHTTGRTYCNMMSMCDQLGDFGRAVEWQQAAERWGAPHADSGYPGICRLHRAEILRRRGALPEAEREARRAAEELADFLADIAGGAFYELGEIRLRRGDLLAALAMFGEAHARGREPQPGLALLRLAEGDRDAASAAVARGELELARGHPDDAALHLRRARRIWLELDMPFELASTRLLLSRACRALGQADEAALEERAGRATLDRIGAKAIKATV